MLGIKLSRVYCVAQKVTEAHSCDKQNHYIIPSFVKH